MKPLQCEHVSSVSVPRRCARDRAAAGIHAKNKTTAHFSLFLAQYSRTGVDRKSRQMPWLMPVYGMFSYFTILVLGMGRSGCSFILSVGITGMCSMRTHQVMHSVRQHDAHAVWQAGR